MFKLFLHVPQTLADEPSVSPHRHCGTNYLLKSDTVEVLAVLPQFPRYYRGNGYKCYGITAVLGLKYVGIPWGWGPGLRYYRSYGVGL